MNVVATAKFDLAVPAVRWSSVGYSLVVEDPKMLDSALLALYERGYHLRNMRGENLQVQNRTWVERADYPWERRCNTCNATLHHHTPRLTDMCCSCGGAVFQRIPGTAPRHNFRTVYIYQGQEHSVATHSLPIPSSICVYTVG